MGVIIALIELYAARESEVPELQFRQQSKRPLIKSNKAMTDSPETT